MKKSLLELIQCFGLIVAAAFLYVLGFERRGASFAEGLPFVLGAVTCMGLGVVKACCAWLEWRSVRINE